MLGTFYYAVRHIFLVGLSSSSLNEYLGDPFQKQQQTWAFGSPSVAPPPFRTWAPLIQQGEGGSIIGQTFYCFI